MSYHPNFFKLIVVKIHRLTAFWVLVRRMYNLIPDFNHMINQILIV